MTEENTEKSIATPEQEPSVPGTSWAPTKPKEDPIWTETFAIGTIYPSSVAIGIRSPVNAAAIEHATEHDPSSLLAAALHGRLIEMAQVVQSMISEIGSLRDRVSELEGGTADSTPDQAAAAAATETSEG